MNKIFVILLMLNAFIIPVFSQSVPDSLTSTITDSVKTDSVSMAGFNAERNSQRNILRQNKLMRISSPPVELIAVDRNLRGNEGLFYMLALVTLLLGFLKVFYSKYFSNIFQVFFNTSLRQNQLTDLLLQAKLSSLMFNVYFFITGGIYCYFILHWYGLVSADNILVTILTATAVISGTYFVKYCCLLFLGWLADMKESAHTYIFITFLVNKIVGICLLPFIIVIAFAKPGVVNIAIIVSFMVIGMLFLSRYLRSYGLIQKDLRIGLLHFIVYIFAIEVIPLMVIYKAVFLSLERGRNP